ncbi:MAG: LapA family protein [Gammaproteobacteria bacterium]|nr:LapA family protein [Gammaproteobacteria bacterium]
MRVISYILLLAVIILGMSFAMLNSGAVVINYYLGHRSFPLSLVLVMTFSGGALLGILIGTWLVLKMKVKNYRLRQRLKFAEKEIENLRAIPLQDAH